MRKLTAADFKLDEAGLDSQTIGKIAEFVNLCVNHPNKPWIIDILNIISDGLTVEVKGTELSKAVSHLSELAEMSYDDAMRCLRNSNNIERDVDAAIRLSNEKKSMFEILVELKALNKKGN
jgi:hypothetical protein